MSVRHRMVAIAALLPCAAAVLQAQVKPPLTRDSLKVPSQIQRPVVPRGPINPGAGVLTTPKSAPLGTPVPAATGVGGYEIVRGPVVEVAPLATTLTSAQCPQGKVPLSTGVDFNAPGDATFGLEILGAWPDGPNGAVRVRNANVLVRANAQAIVVCVQDMPGRRQVDRSSTSSGNDMATACNADERIAGGGTMGSKDLVVTGTVPASDGPQSSLASYWRSSFVAASAVGSTTVQSRGLCYPAQSLARWQLVTSSPIELGAHGQATLSVTCPSGTLPVSFGVQQFALSAGFTNTSWDMVWNSLVPSADGSVRAHVHNRNIVAGNGNLGVKLVAACVLRA